ncbi:hypothetical protein ACIRF8_31630 [Streptomyces sp. NPDC102406]|uniref:hypothetical protein n=1 Tax=Streptomyces sp. NPDC102406 TaxID=3366171 RepID=UPI0037FFBA3D
MIPYLDQLSPAASRVGAVNTVVFTEDGRAVGHNTDIAGFAAARRRNMPHVDTGRVVQLGAAAPVRQWRTPCRIWVCTVS